MRLLRPVATQLLWAEQLMHGSCVGSRAALLAHACVCAPRQCANPHARWPHASRSANGQFLAPCTGVFTAAAGVQKPWGCASDLSGAHSQAGSCLVALPHGSRGMQAKGGVSVTIHGRQVGRRQRARAQRECRVSVSPRRLHPTVTLLNRPVQSCYCAHTTLSPGHRGPVAFHGTLAAPECNT